MEPMRLRTENSVSLDLLLVKLVLVLFGVPHALHLEASLERLRSASHDALFAPTRRGARLQLKKKNENYLGVDASQVVVGKRDPRLRLREVARGEHVLHERVDVVEHDGPVGALELELRAVATPPLVSRQYKL